MKRINNLFEKVIDIENITLAEQKARRNKSGSFGVQLFDKDKEGNLLDLQRQLSSGTYRTGEYDIFKIYTPKEREIARLEYKHRVVHHAIMNVLEPLWVSLFPKNTYSCIKNRGIHKCLRDLKESLKEVSQTQYCLKIDIQKFYPTIDRAILKKVVRKKIKDSRLLALMDETIDSAPGEKGVPIGNYLSQFYANLYLTYFDHWVKEELKVKHYFRYCDDMVFLGETKHELHEVLARVRAYLTGELNLTIKSNYQVFPFAARGIDFVGYVSFHTHVLLRKSIKKNFSKRRNRTKSIASYMGWAMHCNSRNLIKKLINNDHDTFRPETRHDTTTRNVSLRLQLQHC